MSWTFCREIPTGQRGEVCEVDGDRVAVILDKGEKDENTEHDTKPPIYWIPGSTSDQSILLPRF